MLNTWCSYYDKILPSIAMETSVTMSLFNMSEEKKNSQGCIYVKK